MRSLFILATLCLCSGLPQNNLRKSSIENNDSLQAKGEEFGTDLRKTNFEADTVHEAEKNSSPLTNSVISNLYTDSRRAEFSVKSAGEFLKESTNETVSDSTTTTQPTKPTTPPTKPTTPPTQPTTPPTQPTTPPTKPTTPPTQPTTPPTQPTTPPTQPTTPPTQPTTPPTKPTTPPTQPTTPPTTDKPNGAGKIGFTSVSTFVILVLGQLTFKITFFT